jgi:hypothetical protein
MNWDFFIGYWVGVAVSAAIFFASFGDHDDHDDDDDDYHYEYFDDDNIKTA